MVFFFLFFFFWFFFFEEAQLTGYFFRDGPPPGAYDPVDAEPPVPRIAKRAKGYHLIFF